MQPSSSSPGWLSFHVHLPRHFDVFLTRHLLPEVRAWLAKGQLKRFFFIRYSEGGAHLRLRFLPTPTLPPEAVAETLRRLTRTFARAQDISADTCRVAEHPYDRAALYFGDNMLSVYAELLNEQTSYLALRLLRSDGSSPRRLAIVLASAIDLLIHAACDGQDEAQYWLDQGRAVARQNTPPEEAEALDFSDEIGRAWLAALAQMGPRVRAVLDADPVVQRIVALLRRARQQQPRGPEVAAHALHLLCNKTGFGMAQEYRLFETLCRLHGLAEPNLVYDVTTA